MANIEGLKLMGDIGFALATFCANAFVILYLVFARWWQTPFGRHLFTFMLVIALVLDHATISIFWPEYPGRWHVRSVLYPALGLVLLWRLLILIEQQLVLPWRDARKKQRENA